MGREASCQCNWAGTTGDVKALLETNEIILRGEIRRRIPLQKLANVKVQADRLCFSVDREPVQLYLSGSSQAYEIVVNQVKKNEVVGYVAAPKVKLPRGQSS